MSNLRFDGIRFEAMRLNWPESKDLQQNTRGLRLSDMTALAEELCIRAHRDQPTSILRCCLQAVAEEASTL